MILDPDLYPSRISDPGVKKSPDPGFGSAALPVTALLLPTVCMVGKLRQLFTPTQIQYGHVNAGTTRCTRTPCWAPQWCTERPWGWGARSLCLCPGARFPLQSRKDCGYVQTGPLGWTLLSVGHARAVERNQSIFCHLVTRQLYR